MNRALLVLILFASIVPPASATGEIESIITDADRVRLEGYDTTRIEAIGEARAGGARGDVAALDSLLAKPHLSFSDFDMTGAWRCRTVKAGGFASLIVYDWFRCRVTDDGSGWRLEKLTGSQRTTGRFFTEGDARLTYLGSFSVNDDQPQPYGAGPESDQAGYALRTGAAEWRIEFPAPAYESKLDILEFQR